MLNSIKYHLLFISLIGFFACDSTVTNNQKDKELHLVKDFTAKDVDGNVNVVVEIPAGTLLKYEVNKSTGKIDIEMRDGKPRTVSFLGYPGNYGMIPQTILPKENGGDGDPLDILVLGPPVESGTVIQSKVIGVLKLKDRGENDDKLIAVSINSPLYKVNDLSELNEQYNGASQIIELWFANYKGPGKMESLGFGNREEANKILQAAIEAYN